MSNPYPRFLPGDGSIDAIREDHAEQLRRIGDTDAVMPNPFMVAQVASLLAEIDRLTALVPKPSAPSKETLAEEVTRLNREIGQRQLRLQHLVCGDPRVGVTIPIAGVAPDQRLLGKPQ